MPYVSIYDTQEHQTWAENRGDHLVLTKMVRYRLPKLRVSIAQRLVKYGPPTPPPDSVLIGETIRTKLVKDPLPPALWDDHIDVVEWGEEWSEWIVVSTRIEEKPAWM